MKFDLNISCLFISRKEIKIYVLIRTFANPKKHKILEFSFLCLLSEKGKLWTPGHFVDVKNPFLIVPYDFSPFSACSLPL